MPAPDQLPELCPFRQNRRIRKPDVCTSEIRLAHANARPNAIPRERLRCPKGIKTNKPVRVGTELCRIYLIMV
jgi:hypothetical protein